MKRTIFYLTLYLIALIPRIIAVAPFLAYSIALDDMFQYDMLARSIESGQGYRWYTPGDVQQLEVYLSQYFDVDKLVVPENGLQTTFRPPGYPAFLALIYHYVPANQRFIAARLFQAVWLSLLAPITALLATRLGLNRRNSFLAGIGAALYPILCMYPVGLASENLFIPLLLASFLALLYSRQSGTTLSVVLAGIFLSLAMLTRSVVLLFAISAALWLGWAHPKGWKQGVLLVSVALGICLPWAIRNTLVMGKPTFIESSLTYQMYIGYHPQGNGSFISKIATRPLFIYNDVERERYCAEQVAAFIRQDPMRAAGLVLRRAVYFWGVEDRELIYFYTNSFFGSIPQPWLGLIYLGIISPWVFVCLLAPAGLLFSANRQEGLLAILLVASYTLPHLAIISEPRFHLALVPVLIPFAVQGWDERKRWLRQWRLSWPIGRRAILARVSQLVLLFILIWGLAERWGSLVAVLSPGGNHLRFYY